MSKEFHIFKQNTEAIATNRGFYYQYLKTVKLWIDDFIANENNEIYCEREDDIFEYNASSKTYKFRQIKCYSTASGLNSLEVKSSLLNFYMLYLKYDYQGLFYFESNTTIQPRAGKTLTLWIEQQRNRNFSVTNYIDEIREIFRVYIQEKLDTYLSDKNKKKIEKEEAQQKADSFFKGLNESTFESFLESIRWNFAKELDTHKAISDLSEEILKSISRLPSKELFLGHLVNTVLEKSIELDEEKRLLNRSLLDEALHLTHIDDKLFRSEIKELLNANFFIPKILTSPYAREEVFVGREKEFSDMRDFLNNSNSLLLISSIGGMGKTTLVKEFLHRQKFHYEHYGYIFIGQDIKQGFVNNGLRTSLSLVLQQSNESFDEALVKLQNLKGKTLLILDNVEKLENQKDALEKIIGLAQNPNIDIVMTSREKIDEIVNPYELKALLVKDAKLLFNSIYPIEDEALLEELLDYLDYHTFFIEKTARTLDKKKGLLTPREIIKNFPDIRHKKGTIYNDFLTKLFKFDELDKDDILFLKQLSAFPSIDLGFTYLQHMLQVNNVMELQENLEHLVEKGWLIFLEAGQYEEGYKLHQVIKEYIWSNHPPTFEEIEGIVHLFILGMGDVTDTLTAIRQLEGIVYFENLVLLFEKMSIENEIFVTLLTKFGLIYQALADYEKVEPLYGKALEISKSILGEDDFNLATAYANVADNYRDTEEYKKAKEFYDKALEISENLKEEHPHLHAFYNNLALYYKLEKNYEKSKELFLKSLEMRKQIFGEESSAVADSYDSLAHIYQLQKERSIKAEELFIKALEIRTKSLESNHPDIGLSYSNLATFYHTFNVQKFYKYMYKAIEIWEGTLPDNHIYLITAKKFISMIEQENSIQSLSYCNNISYRPNK
jgi:tetratricopeptide (TPR) repeat protein